MTGPSYKFSPSSPAWRGTAIGIFIATSVLMILSTVDLLQNQASLGDAAIYFVGGSLLTALVGGLLVLMLVLFANISTMSKWAIACFAVLVYYFFIPTQTSTGLFFIGIWALAAFALTGGSLWSLMVNRNENRANRLTTLSFLFLGLLGIAGLAFWSYSTLTPFTLPPSKEGEKQIPQITLQDPSLPGTFAVKTLSYGNGTSTNRPEYGKEISIRTDTISGSSLIGGWDGFSGWLRTRYWGFNSNNLPLNGLVWYPEGEGPFPLVLIVHGNHEMSAPSDSGYAYLGNLLASRGFIAASIDENFLNSGWIDFIGNINEVPARAWLILEHLKLWREWNKTEGLPFSNKVDMDKIALIGHSRGGEAIATATAFNNLDYFPENGNIPFNYHFNIKALAAIAPVDSQYSPGGQKTILNNIDYLVIQGAHDGDVRSFQGSAQYNRIFFNDLKYHFRASLYIFGANHGQFNSVWGKSDIQSPANLLFNLNQFLPEQQQRQIAKVYITAFLEAVLHEEKRYMPLFHSWTAGGKWLPKTVYLNEFNDSRETYITNSERALDLGKTTFPGGTVHGEHLKVWQQKQITLREGNTLHPGLYLGWNLSHANGTPSYTIVLPENRLHINSKSTLVLSLADVTHNHKVREANVDNEEDGKHNKNEEAIDFTIELTDSHGEKTGLPLSHFDYLQPAFKLHLMKSDFLDPLDNRDSVFQTFEFPMEEFLSNNPRFDPESLQTIRLAFDRTASGTMILDAISIRNE